MVTHATDIVDKMKKRVVAIDKGKIIRDDYGTYGFADALIRPSEDKEIFDSAEGLAREDD
jgi:energy-coupling factor transporter ATP-binding protein EcfA2